MIRHQPAAPPPVAALRGIAWLLLFQTVGEVFSRALGLPVPGPVVGMVLLFAGLFVPAVRSAVAGAADFLLAHLSLLFVPVGVGVMTHLALLSQYGLRLLAVIVLSTWAGLATTALVLHALRDRAAQGEPPRA
ncbi:CidA/LrgA family protein [Xylophilus sp.]|uniref:CidA/LrgA family protein n=1 Tax=Xylophilus sp. TaxID=2653893 RepID=UPI0013BCFBD8|nr:CidA/LrgA family protein [Xylophilus sp.]KAF1044140.1 MAG: Antiholin-like protein LrgA [Xylophilus sp.]